MTSVWKKIRSSNDSETDKVLAKIPNNVMKLVIIGGSAVGKTALLERFAEGKKNVCDQLYASTIGVDYKVKTFSIKNNGYKSAGKFSPLNEDRFNNREQYICKLQMWDTAGQERYRSITKGYYNETKICLLCFDIDQWGNDGSLSGIDTWLQDIKKINDDAMIFIVATKVDMRRVSANDLNITENSAQNERHTFGKTLRDLFDYNNFSSELRNKLRLNEIEARVDKWNDIQNVRFLGWISTKSDLFIPYVNNEKIISVVKESEHDITNILSFPQYLRDSPYAMSLPDHIEEYDMVLYRHNSFKKAMCLNIDHMFYLMISEYLDNFYKKERIYESLNIGYDKRYGIEKESDRIVDQVQLSDNIGGCCVVS